MSTTTPNGTRKPDVLRLTQLGILLALEAVLAFTPLGFITIPPISITLLHIPVIVGGILLGPLDGAVLGGAFGIFSMIRASMTGNPGDILFNPAASGNPVASIVMSVLPRILIGLIAAWIYLLMKKLTKGKDLAAIPVAAAVATILHTVMVLGLMELLFDAFPLEQFFSTVILLNGLVEVCTAIVIATAVCKPLMHILRKKHRIA